MHPAQQSYTRFKSQLEEIAKVVQPAKRAFEKLNMSTWSETCDRIDQRLKNEKFRVIVLGEFKRGKSTVINAMLGREVLPAFATPCTAIINVLRWGNKPAALLHFRDPLPAQLPKSLPKEALAHINKHSNRAVPSMTIPVEQLEAYVAIPDASKDQAASVAESPYSYVELTWPLPILESGIEIIDSPGLNEHGSRTRVTMDFLGKVDAVVFVMSVNALASVTELAVLEENVRASGHEDVFFLCNRFDELRRQADRDRVVNYAYEQFTSRTTMGRDGIFFVSALDALIAREENKPELLQQSRFQEFETALARFLVQEKGRIKLMQPTRQLSLGTKAALFEVIPAQRKLLSENIKELEERYASAMPKLEEANSRRQRVIHNIERGRMQLRDAVRRESALHLRQIADQIPFWAGELQLENSISMLKVWSTTEQVTAVADEVVRSLQPRIEAFTNTWRESQLLPLVTSHLEDIKSIAEASVRDFMVNLDAIRADFSQIRPKSPTDEGAISPIERVLSSASGLLLGGFGSAFEGATMGFQGMIKGLIPQIMIAIVGLLVLHLNPITVIPAMIGFGLFRAFRQGDALTDKVKGKVAEQMSQMLIANIPDKSEEIAKLVFDQTTPMVTEIDAGLTRELQALREQMDKVLATKHAGVAEIDKQLATVAEAEKELQVIDVTIKEFMAKLAQSRR